MTITKEQKELLTTIVANKENLEELLKMASISKKQVKDLQMKESITFAGISWSKFAEDSDGNAFMLADNIIFKMKFGENNNWKESQIRKKLNEELFQKIVNDLGTDALFTNVNNLFSHDGLDDYGVCEDMVSLLTYDLYRNNRKNIKGIDGLYWTCTPNSTPSGCSSGGVQCVYSNGYVGYIWCDSVGSVRPFCVLNSSIFVSCENVEE